MRDELELVRAAAAGDRTAFTELVRGKREFVVRTAYQITGNLDDALDVAQAVLLKLWQGLHRFDTRRAFDTWLYRITANAAIDSLRARGARPLRPLEDAPEPASGTAVAEEELDLARLQIAFRRLSARLAPQQRAVFVLREIEGQSTAQVAAVLGITESTVRNHLMQARRALREGLLREYPDLLPPTARGTEDES
jgi:RNA polymerase sigma-70 factor (ECF subfamily)